MINTFRVCAAVLFLGGLAAIVTGCDQTADEYHQQKVEQQLALYQSISGSYQGVVTTNGTPCDIEIDLSPSLSSTNSSDGTTTVGTSALQGKVTLNCGTWTATEQIPTMEYSSPNNSQNGTFSGNFQIPLGSDQGSGQGSGTASNPQMSISGSINGNQMTGTLELQTDAGFTGTFTATKNASAGTAQGDTAGSVSGIQVTKYAGSFEVPCDPGMVSPDHVNSTATSQNLCTVDFTMNTALLPKQNNKFYNWFSIKRLMNIGLLAQLHEMGIDDRKVRTVSYEPIGLQDATLDVQNHTIEALQSGVGSANTTMSLNCTQVQINAKTQGWNCVLIGLTGSMNTFIAAPAESTPR